MSFHNNVKNLINKYGSKVTITRGDSSVHSKAFIQPLRYKSNAIKDRGITIGGLTDGRYYLYIGQADNEFMRTDDAIISCNGKQYVIHTSDSFYLYDKALYVWAVLTPYKEQRRDDYETD